MDQELPETFWHCYVRLPGSKEEARQGVVNDSTLADLRRDIIQPWLQGTRFAVAGTIVADKSAISEIRIVYTPRPAKVYSDEHYARMRASGITDFATDPRFLPFSKGVDYTNQLLFAADASSAPQPSIALLLQLCERLPLAARLLASRRKGKTPYDIIDEYDVQDLLHTVIRAYMKYTVDEEPLGKVGGARSSRADLALADLNALIEVKFVHGPNDQQRIVEEFAQDLLLYSAWAPLQTFIYFVYNSADLRDPEALRKLQGDNMLNSKKYRTFIVLA